jgi:hypothetical protein
VPTPQPGVAAPRTTGLWRPGSGLPPDHTYGACEDDHLTKVGRPCWLGGTCYLEPGGTVERSELTEPFAQPFGDQEHGHTANPAQIAVAERTEEEAAPAIDPDPARPQSF